MSARLKRNDRLCWKEAPHMKIWVTRAAKDGTWADIYVYDPRTRSSWTKRQPLPLHESFEVVS